MADYRRRWVEGGTYFFTVVTYARQGWLCEPIARQILREAMQKVKQQSPFTIEAMVLLPDHLHCIWTLPEGDRDYHKRWRSIKAYVTRNCATQLNLEAQLSNSRQKRGEYNLWQRRYWEHTIRDEKDFRNHCNYIHYNPVKHGYCLTPETWQYSTIHRLIAEGHYP
jgi:putative transposase